MAKRITFDDLLAEFLAKASAADIDTLQQKINFAQRLKGIGAQPVKRGRPRKQQTAPLLEGGQG